MQRRLRLKSNDGAKGRKRINGSQKGGGEEEEDDDDVGGGGGGGGER